MRGQFSKSYWLLLLQFKFASWVQVSVYDREQDFATWLFWASLVFFAFVQGWFELTLSDFLWYSVNYLMGVVWWRHINLSLVSCGSERTFSSRSSQYGSELWRIRFCEVWGVSYVHQWKCWSSTEPNRFQLSLSYTLWVEFCFGLLFLETATHVVVCERCQAA